MNDIQIMTLGALAVYFVVMIAIGVLAGRDQTHHGFVIGSRNVGYIPTIGSLATSARDYNVVRYSFPVAGVFLIIMTLSLIFLGMSCAPFMGDHVTADGAFFEIFTAGFMPGPLLAFIAVVVMAICMSTTDTFSYLTAATLGKNFMPERVTGSRDNYILFSRAVILFVLAVASILALSIGDVIKFFFDAASLLFVLGPVYVCAAFGWPKVKNRKTDALMTIGVAVSTLIYLYMFTQGLFNNMIFISVPAMVSIVLTGAAVYFGREKA